jgi:hypothetical protein
MGLLRRKNPDAPLENVAREANELIMQLERAIGAPTSADDPRVIHMFKGAMQCHVLRFEVTKRFNSVIVNVKLIEWPRQKLFEVENGAIIGPWQPTFVHWYCEHLRGLAAQYSGDSSAPSSEPSGSQDWYKNGGYTWENTW